MTLNGTSNGKQLPMEDSDITWPQKSKGRQSQMEDERNLKTTENEFSKKDSIFHGTSDFFKRRKYETLIAQSCLVMSCHVLLLIVLTVTHVESDATYFLLCW